MATFSDHLERQMRVHRRFAVTFVSLVVALHGIFILATTLEDQLEIHRGTRLSDITIDLPLLIGITLVYLSTLLRRRKRTAWSVTVLAYSFYLGIGLDSVLNALSFHHASADRFIKVIIVPAVVVAILYLFRKEFVVRSDIQGFRWASRFSISILLVALAYGVAGFTLLDKSDFHQEIRLPTAVHYTIDQFDLTTNRPLHPYTRRAQVFDDSLSFVSVAAVAFAVLSLFQPLRVRLSDQEKNRERLWALLDSCDAPSEDYFKLWPHDKQYFFDETERSGLAFHVQRGLALCLGDPVGHKRQFKALLDEFGELCFNNDWTPAFVHIQGQHRSLYEKRDFSLQRLGQEAVVDIEHFQSTVAGNKYFRHIRNKFTKQGYTTELLLPPHHEAVLSRLQTISREWLSNGGHVERGFAMGYYSNEYMQQCPIFVVRDAAGTIQAFINQLPATFDAQEATYDLLRHTSASLGNINDYLLLGFIDYLETQRFKRLNLGLCPLVGLDSADTDSNGLIDSLLRFTYANGDRLYSFSGLYRFKTKYEPEWRDRFVAYKGGIRGFSRSMTALMFAMRVKK